MFVYDVCCFVNSEQNSAWMVKKIIGFFLILLCVCLYRNWRAQGKIKMFVRAQNFFCIMHKLQKAEVLQESMLLTWCTSFSGRFHWEGIKPPALTSLKINQTQLFCY